MVRRTAAIGDTLAATCVASKLVEAGYKVRWQCHQDMHGMIRRVPTVENVEEPKTKPHVDLDRSYESHPHRKKVSFAEIFVATASDQLTFRNILIRGPTNCAPELRVNGKEREAAIIRLAPYPQPWVMFAARSNSHVNRTIPDSTLASIAKSVKGTCFWLANHAPAPEGFIDLEVRNLDYLIQAISAADLYVGPDTGPMHVAAALRVPVIALEQASSPELHLSDQRDFLTVRKPGLFCLNCQHVTCPLPGKAAFPPCTELDPDILTSAINSRLEMQSKPESISCIIATFKAPVERLNKCLAHVLNQVDEIIVTKDSGGVFPHGAAKHPKIRYVCSPRERLGYGKNVNFGARHSHGNWLLLLNDDCYLAPDAVKRLLEVGTRNSKIGLVGHLLHYPDGRICHGGKVRQSGHRGWALLDNRKRTHSIREARQIENVTGTSVLVRRNAFYAINGFDEDFDFYNEDDSMNLALQQAGWQIWYTPLAVGIHEEAASTSTTRNMSELLAYANKQFERKWGWWLTENLHRIPTYT